MSSCCFVSCSDSSPAVHFALSYGAVHDSGGDPGSDF